MDNIFLQMGILFLLILAGFICHKCKLMDHEFDRMLSNFIVKVSCPALVLSSTMGDQIPDRELVVPLLGVGVATYFVIGLVSWFAAKLFTKEQSLRGEFAFMLTFGNVSFIGYPVVASLFGTDAIFFASVLNFANAIFIYSLGPIVIAGRSNNNKISPLFLFSPIMLASYAAIAIVLIGLKDFPKLVSEPLSMLGSMTVPGALLIIGSSIAQMPLRGILGTANVYALSLCRLLILPFAVYFFSLLFTDSVQVVTINTVLFAMPIATLGIMFCLIAGKDESTMARATFISTVFSMITIPCVTTVVNFLNTIFLPG
ncbi:MAG: AEC family transporter [Proteobacteria bacterium]|uniref:AEC family transporter n=1 Tax=Candidatus Avisuccinivibrio stercorigallinarum TaxID=2840704 RepID=A0A9D9GSB9_9GAMM|nr:AEC family transporter [Candidatus Avisuccinivibrio stercorigallinarum]